MRITCPSCSTSYSIADDKIGAKGRSVRCASCGNKWHVAPDTQPDPFADGATAPGYRASTDIVTEKIDASPSDGTNSKSAVVVKSDEITSSPANNGSADGGNAEQSIDLESQLAEINRRRDIESLSKKPKIKVSKKKPPRVRKPIKFDMDRFLARARPIVGAMVLALSFGVIGASVMFRTSLVAAFPSLASLYAIAGMPVNLRGLDFANVQMLREVENAQQVLVVEGELTNPGNVERDVPAIRFSLRGDDAQEIYAWSLEPKSTMLTPGATMRFRTRLASPPEQAADIQVRMIDRRNQQAYLND